MSTWFDSLVIVQDVIENEIASRVAYGLAMAEDAAFTTTGASIVVEAEP